MNKYKFDKKKLKSNSIHFLAITIIMGLIILSGCNRIGYDYRVYQVGTEGLNVEFHKTNKQTVYETEQFSNVIFITNKGSKNIIPSNPAILKINYDEYRLVMDSPAVELVKINSLLGKSNIAPVGEEEPFESYFTANLLTKNREAASTKLTYNLCYPYYTELTTMTCIDTKMALRDESAAACKSTPYAGSGGQGAPIVITKIEPEIQVKNNYIVPQFKIYISNAGRGYVTSAERCEGTNAADITNSEEVGYVNVRAEISGVELICGTESSRNKLRISDSTPFIRCSLPEGGGYIREQKNYLTPLTVNVTYSYINIEETEIEIKRDETIPLSERRDFEENVDPCPTYMILYGGKCISKCEYCSQYASANDGLCDDNLPFETFQFKPNFECACSLAKCEQLSSKGECIKSYCPGTNYCCAANPCASWQILTSDGKTCEDKCTYCAANPTDIKCNKVNVAEGFKCKTLGPDQLPIARAIPYKVIGGFCQESRLQYCTNYTGGLDVAAQAYKIIETDNSNNLCDFCAGNGGCSFENNGIKAKITSDFSCSCSLESKNILELYNFVPDTKYCQNDLYCCNIPK